MFIDTTAGTLLSVLLASTFVQGAQPNWPRDHWRDKYRKKNWPDKPQVYTPWAPPINGCPQTSTFLTSTAPTPNPNPTTPPTPSACGTTSATSTHASKPCKEDNACCKVRSLQASFPDPDRATVPAALAYECITSVPYNQSAAIAFLDSVRPYIDWQTTLQWVKSPPAEYAEKVQAPYDFWAEWTRIYKKASCKENTYENEYAFGFDVYRAVQRCHDGHFSVYPDSVSKIFDFGRTTPLVSVSLDGSSIPEVYVYQDVLDTIINNSTYTPSPLAKIDGHDSTEYLLHWSQYGSLEDPDALWNNLFYLLPQINVGSGGTGTGTFSGGGRGAHIYPGPSTTLTFANGTSITNENFARVLVPFDKITSGADIYKEYFIPPVDEPLPIEVVATRSTSSSSVPTSTSPTTATTTPAIPKIPAPGYPRPFVRDEEYHDNSGYFLEGEGYDDVAVLSVNTFVDGSDGVAFQALNEHFINEALKRKKTKLIVDISANRGGTQLQGVDLFKQLFPLLEPYMGQRFRAHEAFDYVGQEISYFSGLLPRSLKLNLSSQYIVMDSCNYRTDVDINGNNFSSWQDKYGPVTLGPGPDNYTELFRKNYSDPLITTDSGGIVITGYQSRSNYTHTPFKPENIVIVSDGYCASSCAVFFELMTQQAGIKTIILGGRPNKSIAQAAGGTRGTYSMTLANLVTYVVVPFQYQYLHNTEFYEKTALAAYNDLVVWRTTTAVINGRDAFRQGDTSNIPLQFQYQPADCRIYYTPEMSVDMTAVWKTVADSAFNGINYCVAGSLRPDAPLKERRDSGRDAENRQKHEIRHDLNIDEHRVALKNVWTRRRELFPGGDGVMLP